ncbi:divalent-cation tolerance protein CutA [Caenimonas sedimenti]|uniref:Divalent-cation tolerance protein CutA n=2 Tax=Caenimonas sedimenti TaxID=2596921 RepID=A0A562ZPW2_9BURK|nr:divalent-cation tolerance protein CutA [Caenimonas sedimenti]
MEDREQLEILTVTTAVGSRPDAEKLARAVIDARLAACVQLDAGLVSIYRWQGQVCEETEIRLTLKTIPEAEPALRTFLGAQHPYDVPQYTCWRAIASPDYAHWVRGEVVMPAGA